MKKLFDLSFIKTLLSFGAVVRNDAVTIEDLNDELLNLNAKAENIQAKADTEGRGLSVEEQKELDDVFDTFKDVEEDISRRQRIASQRASLEQSQGRKTEPKAKVYKEPKAHSGMNGFNHFGDFAQAVKNAANPANPIIDKRLIMNAPTTYGSEGVGADGGFAVPDDVRSAIQVLVFGDESIIGQTDQLTSTSNVITNPTDEATPWGTAGIQAAWEGEADQFAQSKPNLKSNSVRLNKLASLVPITEEQLEDSVQLNSYLNSKVPEVLDYKINDALFNGTGAGMPLGILNSGALVTVAKEGSQVAATVVFENIVKMYSRMKARDRKNAVWFINQDIEPQLFTMSFEGTSSSVPAYMPAGGLSGSPYATLLGRPIIPIENAQTLGTEGDIMFCNMKQYMTGQKVGGMRSEVSMHLWFDYDVTAFKFVVRVAGQPWLSAPISPANGSNTYSPFVSLAVRA